MHVDAAQTGQVEHVLAQDLAVCRDDEEVGALRAQAFESLVAAQRLGLVRGQAELQRGRLHGLRTDLATAPRLTVGLRDDQGHVHTRVAVQSAQGGHREIGGAHEDDAEAFHDQSSTPSAFRRAMILS